MSGRGTNLSGGMPMETEYDNLVRQLEQVEGKEETVQALRAGGEAAKPALLRGLEHPCYRVRHGCLLALDHGIIDDPVRVAILKALDDPNRKVRRAALHVLGCEACKPEGYCGIEGVDLEAISLELARRDPSQRVRRSAIGTFQWRTTLEDHVADVMREAIASDWSYQVRKRAAMALAFPLVAQLPNDRNWQVSYDEAVRSLLGTARPRST